MIGKHVYAWLTKYPEELNRIEKRHNVSLLLSLSPPANQASINIKGIVAPAIFVECNDLVDSLATSDIVLDPPANDVLKGIVVAIIEEQQCILLEDGHIFGRREELQQVCVEVDNAIAQMGFF